MLTGRLLKTVPSEIRCRPSMRISPTVKLSSAACARAVVQNGWLGSAANKATRNSSRTRQRPGAISVGGAARATPLVRLEFGFDHDFPFNSNVSKYRYKKPDSSTQPTVRCRLVGQKAAC